MSLCKSRLKFIVIISQKDQTLKSRRQHRSLFEKVAYRGIKQESLKRTVWGMIEIDPSCQITSNQVVSSSLLTI